MPIYAYRCSACGHAQDVLRKISDPLLSVCPACGQASYVKQVTAAGFQLKGSGWYVTDFRGGKGAGEPGAKADAGSDAKPDAKADSKVDGKGEAKGNGEPKTDMKADVKADVKADRKPAPKSETGSGAKPAVGGSGAGS